MSETTYHYDSLKGHIVAGPEINEGPNGEVYHYEYVVRLIGSNWRCTSWQKVKVTNLDRMVDRLNLEATNKYHVRGRIRGPYIHNVCNHPSTGLNQR